ncbi:hypothetical protein OESDEN_08839 [Oesophagostomum dentatum]|uniref:DUF4440 domain-containing protein n=1 Tax=Oesophagostomum dentatum TaxID=61180 RepID=A0A0B1T7C9_OESDE|nr:hypothetical protein OESDEN_08839 [Oesophagostomum dentatum]
MGRTKTEFTEEKYQMTDDYIIVNVEYRTTTEKMGTLRGRFTQIWKKVEDSYVIIYDIFREI